MDVALSEHVRQAKVVVGYRSVTLCTEETGYSVIILQVRALCVW